MAKNTTIAVSARTKELLDLLAERKGEPYNDIIYRSILIVAKEKSKEKPVEEEITA